MTLLVDMNLSPRFASALNESGFSALHWSEVGAFNAPDTDILAYAKANDFVVVTHDLDFSSILAKTQLNRPSVIQIRATQINSLGLINTFINELNQHQNKLNDGALMTFDEKGTRIRELPL